VFILLKKNRRNWPVFGDIWPMLGSIWTVFGRNQINSFWQYSSSR